MSESKSVKNGLSITSLVLGILALIGSWLPVIQLISIILAVVGLIFGIVAIVNIVKANGKKSFTIISIIINVSAVLIVFLTFPFYARAMIETNDGPQAHSNNGSALNLEVGQTATLGNGLTLTVEDFERDIPDKYLDKRYTAVTVTIENDSTERQSFSPMDWESINANGVVSMHELVVDRENSLEGGQFMPGGKVTGNIYFKNDTVKIAYVNGYSNTVIASWDIG